METNTQAAPIYKLINRVWKTLPDKGDDVFLKDDKLKEGRLGDLSKKTVVQLEEILQRQDRTLHHVHLVQKLKDKGESLRKSRQEVAEALEAAREREKASQNSNTVTDINAMEWRGAAQRRKGKTKEILDSDDDEDDDDESDIEEALDPLRLMAYHSSDVKRPAGTGTRVDESNPLQAIAKELQQLDLMDATNTNTAPHDFGSQRILRLKEKEIRNGPKKDPFKPYRPVNNPQPLPNMPVHIHPPSERAAICLPVEEAIKREQEYVLKEKRQQLMDRVTDRKQGRKTTSATRYHDANEDHHLLDPEAEDEEWGDDAHVSLPLPDDGDGPS